MQKQFRPLQLRVKSLRNSPGQFLKKFTLKQFTLNEFLKELTLNEFLTWSKVKGKETFVGFFLLHHEHEDGTMPAPNPVSEA